jgi:multicomponent Na+:H+ antiporter subunit E
MMAFLVTTVTAFLFYLLLSTSSGNLFLWGKEEIIIGIIFAIIVGAITKNIFIKKSYRMLSPRRVFLFLFYFIWVWFPALAIANIDVAYRVITGKINPGIVKISPKLPNDLSLMILANSITLTPGTLSVEVDEKTNDLYVHWINVNKEALTEMPRDPKYVCGKFPEWARRIAG